MLFYRNIDLGSVRAVRAHMLNFTRTLALAFAMSAAFSAPSVTPVFEVASIKLCPGASSNTKGGGARGGGGGVGERNSSPDRLSLPCQPVKELIRMAYLTFADGHPRLPVSLPPIEGGPAWAGSERYKVDAKAEGTPGQDMMKGPMLQALLEDRLKLKVHRETREVPAYILVVAKNGPKLQPYQEGSCIFPDPSNRLAYVGVDGRPRPLCTLRMVKPGAPSWTWEVHGGTLDDLARALGSDLDRVVINKTRLPGRYDFHLEFAPDQSTNRLDSLRTSPDSPSDPAGAPSIFTALQQQLGLKLEAGKGPREFFVVDHVEKPSEN
jgi:uncharacterized protein (TIGR03435 family)